MNMQNWHIGGRKVKTFDIAISSAGFGFSHRGASEPSLSMMITKEVGDDEDSSSPQCSTIRMSIDEAEKIVANLMNAITAARGYAASKKTE